ncbi:MAG: RNA polymerase sigma factor [Planctomycetaceae bacterium]|nr:RNA polymerase sigma factor [Planctomycetaceae bacterium]
MDNGIRTLTAEVLVREYYQAVYRFAFRLSGSSGDAEDLTQQTFLVACRKLESLRDVDRARSWLFTIVRNLYLKSRPAPERETASLSDVAEPTAHWEWDGQIDQERLQLALNDLPEAYRTPLLLYYFEDSSYKEIAQVLEAPIGTVMSRLSRAKEALRQALGSAEDAGLVSQTSRR